MKNNFFKPFVGKDYSRGISRKKILIVGASFYCNHPDCQYFDDCTDPSKKDSSDYNYVCPYMTEGMALEDSPTDSINEEYGACNRFGDYLKTLIPSCESIREAWDHVAFTNYVQFFLPAQAGSASPTCRNDLSERDFKAFIEVAENLLPNVIVIWGAIINTPLVTKNKYVTDRDMIEKSRGYLCHMTLPLSHHNVSLLNPYHPSSGMAWYTNLPDFDKYMHIALKSKLLK